MSYEPAKCECGHYLDLHTVPGHKPLKLGRCLRLTGCPCEKFTRKESA